MDGPTEEGEGPKYGRTEGRERDLLGIKWMSALPGTGRRDTYLSLSSSARTSRSLGSVFRSIQKGSNPRGSEEVFPFQMRDVNQTERMHFVRKVSPLRRHSRQIVFAFPTTSPESKSYLSRKEGTNLVGSDFVVDLLDADLPRADVPAHRAQVLHPRQRQLAEVAVLDA